MVVERLVKVRLQAQFQLHFIHGPTETIYPRDAFYLPVRGCSWELIPRLPCTPPLTLPVPLTPSRPSSLAFSSLSPHSQVQLELAESQEKEAILKRDLARAEEEIESLLDRIEALEDELDGRAAGK